MRCNGETVSFKGHGLPRLGNDGICPHCRADCGGMSDCGYCLQQVCRRRIHHDVTGCFRRPHPSCGKAKQTAGRPQSRRRKSEDILRIPLQVTFMDWKMNKVYSNGSHIHTASLHISLQKPLLLLFPKFRDGIAEQDIQC